MSTPPDGNLVTPGIMLDDLVMSAITLDAAASLAARGFAETFGLRVVETSRNELQRAIARSAAEPSEVSGDGNVAGERAVQHA